MRRWIWYVLALLCAVFAFSLTPTFTWQYFTSAFLYMLVGALILLHVDRGCEDAPVPLDPEKLREIDKEYR